MSRLRSTLPIVAVPLALAVVVLAAVLAGGPRPSLSPPLEVPITEVLHACPTTGGWNVATGQLGPGDETTVSVISDDGVTEAPRDPALWEVGAPGGDAVVVRQDGDGSGGVAFAAASGDAVEGGGLAVDTCGGIVDEAWFVGAGAVTRGVSTLVLTNLSDVPAVADVELFGVGGVVDAVDSTGLLVEPGSMRRIRLDELAAGEAELAVRVVRQRGALAATVIDTSTTGPAGSEVMAPVPGPARAITMTGVVPGGGRTLLVANPGESSARAEIEIVGPDGPFVPEGLAEISVEPGALVVVPVPDTAGADASVLRVRSDEPVVASLRMSPTAVDLAYATADPTWTGPTVVPVALGSSTVPPVVQLSAVADTSLVTFEGFDAAGASLGTTVASAAADAVAVVDLAAPGLFTGEVAYVVATAERPVRGSAVYRSGDLVAVVPLDAAPTTAIGPRVRPAF
ncbi:hypothetical protein HMPREF0063_11877 [Aeromicrobium marinum DSM 15272]|uniref:Uncharacterized protein n=1 Tax=Aeromicrobium marinum DSM 15272 TaxID=585531 RepID=E2SDU1_9ACTN|nr:hypothetical protein HMPREF0063_11877 [Aeromicrobium marinum DSM 15272]